MKKLRLSGASDARQAWEAYLDAARKATQRLDSIQVVRQMRPVVVPTARTTTALAVGLFLTEGLDDEATGAFVDELIGEKRSVAPLSVVDWTALVEGSGLDPEEARHLLDPEVARTEERALWAHELLSVPASTYSATQLATALDCHVSTISRRAKERQLYRFEWGGHKRYPAWQVHSGQLLPGLEVLVPAIPDTVVPAAVDAFMTSKAEALDGRTPVEWLTTGGSAEAVADLVAELAW